MKRIFKSLFCMCLAFICAIMLGSCKNEKYYDIVSTNFVGYDLARMVNKDLSVNMLISPGAESHSFEPSAKDIRKIMHAKIFIYAGGESDEWLHDIVLKKLDKDAKVISMMDVLEKSSGLILEESPEALGENSDGEYDEHVWTSPKNASLILDKIKEAVEGVGLCNDFTGYESAKADLLKIDSEYKSIVSNAKNNLIVVADRFPLLYFVKEYGINYDAALMGCSNEGMPSAKTIRNLVKRVDDNNLNYIFKIELTNGEISRTVAAECKNKVEILTFYTMHNISNKMFNDGETYITLSNKNIDSLRKALS